MDRHKELIATMDKFDAFTAWVFKFFAYLTAAAAVAGFGKTRDQLGVLLLGLALGLLTSAWATVSILTFAYAKTRIGRNLDRIHIANNSFAIAVFLVVTFITLYSQMTLSNWFLVELLRDPITPDL